MRSLLAVALLLLSPVVFAHEPMEEGALAAGAWEGVVLTNPGEFRASLTLSLRRGEQLVEQVPLELAPGQTRTIRMDRLFVTTADGAAIAFRSSQRILVSGYRGSTLTPAATLITTKRRSVRSGPSAPPVVIVHRTVVLTPSKDNTLFETTDGSLSNGAGPHTFVGMTQGNSKRRTLLAFDVASQIPPGSTVTRVALRVSVAAARSNAPPALHRLTADWGQGASNAGFIRDGIGSQAQANDATWLHRFFPNTRWTTAGGDFAAAADATSTPGLFEEKWESAAMIARMQQWLDQPATNFGWIVIGDESRPTTAKRYDSREADSEANRPALTIEFDTRQ